jgi:hypothetical protein
LGGEKSLKLLTGIELHRYWSFPRLGGEKSVKLLTGIESTPLKRNSTTYQKNCTRLGGETSPQLLARIESIPLQKARILNKTILKRMGEML